MEVGDTVWIKPRRNARCIHQEEFPTRITRIGRKYFYTERPRGKRFLISTLKQDSEGYTPDYIAYQSRQEILDERERVAIGNRLREVFSRGGLTLSLGALRRINAIVEFQLKKQ